MGSQAKSRPRAKPGRDNATRSAASAETRQISAAASAETRRILNSLRQIVRSLRVSSRNAEQRVGLSGAQLFVLQCLSRQSPCSVNELAARTATDQSSVSVVVSRLFARGLVKRKSSPLDRRRVELSLTPAGRTLLTTAPEAAQDRLLSALSQLQQPELSQLSALLERVVELADASRESPSLFFEDGPTLLAAKARGTHERR